MGISGESFAFDLDDAGKNKCASNQIACINDENLS
jgi:hypothetical protein